MIRGIRASAGSTTRVIRAASVPSASRAVTTSSEHQQRRRCRHQRRSFVSVAMIGGSGAVGSHALQELLDNPEVERVTLYGRRKVDVTTAAASATTNFQKLHQEVVDFGLGQEAFAGALATRHDVALCALGVGEPSKASNEEFKRVDHDIPLDFARACREAGVKRFSLLSSVDAAASSKAFYLRTKGELEDSLRELEFEGLSLFHPSMILTPTNRYGLVQAVVLVLWPMLTPMLSGKNRKYRGIEVDTLGRSMGRTVVVDVEGVEVLEWDQIRERAGEPQAH